MTLTVYTLIPGESATASLTDDKRFAVLKLPHAECNQTLMLHIPTPTAEGLLHVLLAAFGGEIDFAAIPEPERSKVVTGLDVSMTALREVYGDAIADQHDEEIVSWPVITGRP